MKRQVVAWVSFREEKYYSTHLWTLDINASDKDTNRSTGIKIIYDRSDFNEPDWKMLENIISFSSRATSIIKKHQIRDTPAPTTRKDL